MTLVSVPFEDWPHADRDLWERLVTVADALCPAGGLAHLRDVTRRKHRYAYGCWLGTLSRGEPAALFEPPVARATTDRFRRWMEALTDKSPYTRLLLLSSVLRVLQTADPSADWCSRLRLIALVRHEAVMTPPLRKIGRIRSSADLFDIGSRLAGGGSRASAPASLQEARDRRDGTMIAFLALMPVRRRAFCSLELGRSILVSDGTMRIVLDPSLMKTATWWEASVPSALGHLLRDYLAHVRPWFLRRRGERHPMLWVNDSGRPYHPSHLGDRLTWLMHRLTGAKISPQLFRDCAATTLTTTSPDAARLTRALLGHSNFRTAERHYVHARGIEAGRAYAATLDALMGVTS